jgi:hypothetical protein
MLRTCSSSFLSCVRRFINPVGLNTPGFTYRDDASQGGSSTPRIRTVSTSKPETHRGVLAFSVIWPFPTPDWQPCLCLTIPERRAHLLALRGYYCDCEQLGESGYCDDSLSHAARLKASSAVRQLLLTCFYVIHTGFSSVFLLGPILSIILEDWLSI